MSCPKLIEKFCSQFKIFDFFTDILYKIMGSISFTKMLIFALKIRPWFLKQLKHHIFLAFVITRYLHNGRIIDKLN